MGGAQGCFQGGPGGPPWGTHPWKQLKLNEGEVQQEVQGRSLGAQGRLRGGPGGPPCENSDIQNISSRIVEGGQ